MKKIYLLSLFILAFSSTSFAQCNAVKEVSMENTSHFKVICSSLTFYKNREHNIAAARYRADRNASRDAKSKAISACEQKTGQPCRIIQIKALSKTSCANKKIKVTGSCSAKSQAVASVAD